MNAGSLVKRIEEYLGIDSVLVEEDEERRWHSVVWFATSAGIPVFGVTIFSGDGINWRVGGTRGMPDQAMRELSQLHEVTCEPEKCKKTQEGCEETPDGCEARESADIRADS